jgi:hypothetical protein
MVMIAAWLGDRVKRDWPTIEETSFSSWRIPEAQPKYVLPIYAIWFLSTNTGNVSCNRIGPSSSSGIAWVVY